jgi:hypothetical protein
MRQSEQSKQQSYW